MRIPAIATFPILTAACLWPIAATAGTCTGPCLVSGTEPQVTLDPTAAGALSWELEASSTGGQFRIGLDGTTAEPFRIESGAGSNLLYLDDLERIGINTNVPAYTVEAVGNRIRLRNPALPQRILDMRVDGTDTDIMSTGANLFLRSATAGKHIVMNPSTIDGFVGIGTTMPTKKLHIREFGSGAGFRVETAGVAAPTDWYFTANAVTGAFLISNFDGGGAQFQVFPGQLPSTFVVRGNRIGVGTQSPTQKLTIAPGGNGLASAWLTYSSASMKDDVQTLDGALEVVEQLRGVSFQWKDSGKPSIGLIAEEVAEVLPELVAFDENGTDTLGLDYDKLTAVLVEAVKSQQKEIDELKAANRRIAELEARLARLDKALQASATP